MKEHDFGAALEGIPNPFDDDEITVGEFRERSLKWLGQNYYTIRHALTLAKKMQDEGLVLCHEREG